MSFPPNLRERYVDERGRLTIAGLKMLESNFGAGGGGSATWPVSGTPAAILGTTSPFTITKDAKLAGIAAGATANATDAALRDRATHTGTQAAATITGLATVATSGAYGDLSGLPTIPAGWAVRILTATQAMVNNTTMQDWFATAGGLPLLANSTYEFSGLFFSLNGVTSHGLNMQFAAITGGSIQWHAIGAKVTAAAQATALRQTATDTFATARNVTTASTVGGNIVKVWGTVRTTTAGVLRPQMAQTAASGSWVAQPGTYFRAIRLGADTLTNTGEWS